MIICEKSEIERIMNLEKNKSDEYQGFVYIIDYGDCVKIGCTKKPYRRLLELEKMIERYGNRKSLRFYVSDEHTNYYKNETMLHEFFSAKRINGTELFNISFENAVLVANNKMILKNESLYLEKQSAEDIKRLQELFFSLFHLTQAQNTGKIIELFSKMNDNEIDEAIRRLTLYSNMRNDLKEFLEEFL